MNNVCPNCGITGPNFSCPNHTYCWGTGNTQSPTIQPQVTWMPVSDQLSNSSLFAEIGRLNVLLNERNKEIERLKGLMPPDERGPGFVGQGSWSVFAEKVVAERDALREVLTGLREKGIIDQHNRPLPLEGHHKDCGHGKDGWSLCTCEELEGKKTCDHGNTECKRCGVGQPTIKTPEGKPLLPSAEFSVIRIEDNKERGFSECNFQRQTGRTTSMVIKALKFVKQNAMGEVLIEVHSNQMKKNVNDRLKHYADEMGVEQAQLSRVCVSAPIEYSLSLRDNVFDDMKENKPTRDPHQDLKVGDIVRFERTGVITDRQTGGIVKDYEGNDFEPVQYVIREALSGNKSFVPCNQILTVIGKEEEEE